MTLRNTNSFSKPSHQRDLREEPSAKQFAINIHKPDECGGVSVIPFEKVEIISKGGFFSTSSGQEILLIQHRVEEKKNSCFNGYTQISINVCAMLSSHLVCACMS